MKGFWLSATMSLAVPALGGGLTATVDAALARSPAVAEAAARERQAAAAGREASYSRLPRLTARGAAMRGDDPLFAFGQLLQERRVSVEDFAPDRLNRPGYRSSVTGALELGMPLFTGFELTRARRLADLGAAEARSMGGAAGQAVSVAAIEAHLDLLKNRALLAELDARLVSASAEIERSQRLSRSGLVLGSDHQAALALLSSLKAWRAKTRAEADAAAARLNVLTGHSEPADGQLGPWTAPLEDDAALVADALASRPELAAASRRREASAVRRAAANSVLLPRVEAFAAVTSVSDGLSTGAGARMGGVRASVAFGDPTWGARRNRYKEDEAAAAAAAAGAADAARGEVLGRAAAVRGLQAALPELDEGLTRAASALDLARPLYREGRLSALEVLRAEEARARMTEARLQAQAGLRTQWAALAAARGRLDADAVSTLARSLEEVR
ncbi:MAG: TolC family protein [Elusimicrobia bacterium]|nr:TolC family protein [Elusimicrobiota bacterium]